MTPMRSCVGCGTRAPQPELRRMTWRDGALHLDVARRAGGRGGYLHDRAACWGGFIARRGPVRSLRTTVPRAVRQELVRQLAATVARGREE